MGTEPKTCSFCGAERRVSYQAHRENPFCSVCLTERLEAAAREDLSLATQGEYTIITARDGNSA